MQSLTPQSIGILSSVKVETLAASAFCELHYPVKFAIFMVNVGLCTVMLSDMHLFCKFFIEPKNKAMQPIVLYVQIASVAYLDKTGVSSEIGPYVKGEDVLLQ